MRASGVDDTTAKTMWAAVRYFGPRWRAQDKMGNCLSSCDQLVPVAPAYNERWFRSYVDWIKEDPWQLGIGDLENLADFCDAVSSGDESAMQEALFLANPFGGQEWMIGDFLNMGCPAGELPDLVKEEFAMEMERTALRSRQSSQDLRE